MSGRINADDIATLRERANMQLIVGEYTTLKRAGSRLKGLCPFHSEKTPSFTVDPARGYYHCFGCGTGGDVYAFVRQIEALTFPEAVERVASLSGYTLRYEELSPGQRKALGRRTRLAEVLAAAGTWYAELLRTPDGAPARDYLRSRGLDAAAADRFRLGWAPDRWDGLVRHLLDEGFSTDEVVDAGLATQGRRGPIDRFRGRVLFPITDRSGRDIVSFGGRVLPGVELATGPRDGTPPKYINGSETEIYKKTQTLYGLSLARAAIQARTPPTVLVVEGYMDVVGLHLAGVDNAVATCGTALTAEHFRQLETLATRVVLALDADDAGFAAADRAREIAESTEIRDVGVLPLADGQDPADLAAEGTEAVEAALARVATAVEFQLEHVLRGADTTTPEGQVAAYRATFDLLRRIPDRHVRYRYIRDRVAPVAGLPADRIEAELDEAGAPAPASPSTPTRSTVVQMAGTAAAQASRDPQIAMERDVLRVALVHPELLGPEWAEVDEDDFTAAPSKMLLGALRSAAGAGLDAVLDALPDDDARARVRALALSDDTLDPRAEVVATLVSDLRRAAVTRRIRAVSDELATVERRADPERHATLTRRLFELQVAKHRADRPLQGHDA